MSDIVLRELSDQIGVLTLNAPERRNALSAEMRLALVQAVEELGAEESCRAIVITGAGGHFSAGGDIKPSAEANLTTRERMTMLQRVARAILDCRKPTIAAVEGIAFGAGLSLAAACDIVVASSNARFCAAFGRVGLVADAGLTWSLPQRVGTARAREMLLTARVVDAAAAASWGLANELADAGGALARARSVAAEAAALAPLSVAAMKDLLSAAPAGLPTVLELEMECQVRLAQSEDYAEGKRAFAERRAAVFRGR